MPWLSIDRAALGWAKPWPKTGREARRALTAKTGQRGALRTRWAGEELEGGGLTRLLRGPRGDVFFCFERVG
ncbi:protein of unknown function [Candidatus Methylocalor cossyra]|uniref:Uncharacterized protein n=1 Tax=Candidatus Methylocalor cossyra TaxID=3108543 RepID=A0ABP1CB24_9GAMM